MLIRIRYNILKHKNKYMNKSDHVIYKKIYTRLCSKKGQEINILIHCRINILFISLLIINIIVNYYGI